MSDPVSATNLAVDLITRYMAALPKDAMTPEQYAQVLQGLDRLQRVESARLTLVVALLTGKEKVSERLGAHDLQQLLAAVTGGGDGETETP
jgi:hypothetical protein